ncbi:MAG: tetratricopeptide repeat protein [Candidatus Hodarchaeales archaeon]
MNSPVSNMLDIINESIQDDPKNPHLWIKKGNLLLELEEFEEAGSCFDQAIKFGPDIPSSIEAKGIYHTKIGENSAALKWYDELIKISPEEANSWGLKAKCLELLNEPTEALKCYYQILDLKPQISSTYKHIADVFLKLNNKSDAVKFYKQYLSLNPYDEYGKEQLAKLSVPIEEDYSQYLPIKYFSQAEFDERFGFHPPEIFFKLFEAAYYENNPTTFFNSILGCDIYEWYFEKDGKIKRLNGEPPNYYSIFSKIHNQSYGVLRTHNGEVFGHFNGEEGTVDIVTQSVAEGLEHLYKSYLKYTLSNISNPDVYISSLLNDPGTQILFYILDKELNHQSLAKYKNKN